ncbi:MAG: hypothetical protein ACRC5C_00315, partial [Bacilli bacterium]
MPNKKHTKVIANAAIIAALLAPTAYVGPIGDRAAVVEASQVQASKLGTIKQISSDRVETSTGTYKVISKQMKAFFSNKQALAGAKLSVVTNAQNEIVAIQDLELNARGKRIQSDATRTKGNVVLHGQGLTLRGNLTINNDYLTVSNLKVSKDVIAQSAAATIVHFKNVEVAGRTILSKAVTGKATVANAKRQPISRLVRMENSSVNSIQSATKDTSIQAVGDTKVNVIDVDSFTIINAASTAQVGKVVASPKVRTLSVNGPVQQLDVKSPVMTIWGNGRIQSLDALVKGTLDVKVSGTVEQLNVRKEGTNVTIAERSNAKEVIAHAQVNITSPKPLSALTVAESVENFTSNDNVKRFTVNGKTNVTLAKGAEVALLVANDNAEVNAENGVPNIGEVNVSGATTALKLNVATDVLNVTTDTKEKVHVSGSATIGRVKLNSEIEAIVRLSVPKVLYVGKEQDNKKYIELDNGTVVDTVQSDSLFVGGKAPDNQVGKVEDRPKPPVTDGGTSTPADTTSPTLSSVKIADTNYVGVAEQSNTFKLDLRLNISGFSYATKQLTLELSEPVGDQITFMTDGVTLRFERIAGTSNYAYVVQEQDFNFLINQDYVATVKDASQNASTLTLKINVKKQISPYQLNVTS